MNDYEARAVERSYEVIDNAGNVFTVRMTEAAWERKVKVGWLLLADVPEEYRATLRERLQEYTKPMRPAGAPTARDMLARVRS